MVCQKLYWTDPVLFLPSESTDPDLVQQSYKQL